MDFDNILVFYKYLLISVFSDTECRRIQPGPPPRAARAVACHARPVRTFPLGETCNRVMKASLQRHYIGVRDKRVVQERRIAGIG